MAASIWFSKRKSPTIRRAALTRMATLSNPRRTPRLFRHGICLAMSLLSFISRRGPGVLFRVDGQPRVVQERLAGQDDHPVGTHPAYVRPSPGRLRLRQARAAHVKDFAGRVGEKAELAPLIAEHDDPAEVGDSLGHDAQEVAQV